MMSNARQSVVPTYLFLCLLLGGSAQGIWANMILQLIGIAIIAWALIERPAQAPTWPARQLLWLAASAIAVVAIQLIPLPVGVWTGLGGRERIAEGFAILGLPLPSMPASLAPHRTIDSLLAAIPPLAIVLGIVRLKAYRPALAAGALIAGAVAGIGLSALQVTSGNGDDSPFYLYPITNRGLGVGFFANANHMATLLLVSLPFTAALVPAARGSQLQRYSAFVTIAAGLALLILVGVGLNRSLAGYTLIVPVLLGSLLLVLDRVGAWKGAIAAAAGLILVVAVAMIATTGIGRDQIGAEARESTGSRAEIWAPTLEIAREHLPLGSGLGSFRPVFAMHEDPDKVTPTYVIHAHNDYLEWVLELGLPGLVLMLAFLAWWVVAVVRVWRDRDAGTFARAASIASAAVLAHSLVDFPLRTSAIAGCFAFCLALLADRRSPQLAKPGDLRPTRHVVIR